MKPDRDRVRDVRKIVGPIPPGVLIRVGSSRNHVSYDIGTLWTWVRGPEEHYLLQASHVRGVHRVQAVFWTQTIASLTRDLVDHGMRTQDLAVYTMLRAAGIIPLTWSEKAKAKAKKPKRKARR